MNGDHAHHHGGMDHGDTVGLHGMLLFGQDVNYLSHLPMFESPHNFQVILEVRFDDAAAASLASDRGSSADAMYTFVPELFPIAELAQNPGGEQPARTEITGRIVHGHFEHGGFTVADNVVAHIEHVIVFQVLDPGAVPNPDRELTYLCFGRAAELFLVHEITARPNFDQVVSARLVPGTGTDQAGRRLSEDVAGREFASASPVRFRGRSDTPDSRLAASETVDGFYFQSIGPGGVHGFLTQIEVQQNLYLQIDELA